MKLLAFLVLILRQTQVYSIVSGSVASLRIPHQRNWSKEECGNLPHFDFECPHERLVAMDKTIRQGLKVVEDGVHRISKVEPLVIARLYRGGKTTVLKALFERLKEENYLPIIVSLNGSFSFRPGETPLQALIRLIAVQFIDVVPDEEDARNFVCHEHDLCQYLNALHNKPIVLIIDELNRLGVPLDVDVAAFLKNCFLDKVGRYLVFSSHVIDIFEGVKPAASFYMKSTLTPASDRHVRTIDLPFCSDKMTLRGMGDDYSGLTDLEVTLGGGIPSLVYVEYQSQEESMKDKFNAVMRTQANDRHIFLRQHQRDSIERFLWELQDGIGGQSLFGSFADSFLFQSQPCVRYPLPYVSCIWEWLTADGSVGALINTLSVHAKTVEGGKDWEVIIVTALYLRFLFCQYVPIVLNEPNQDPLKIVEDGVASVLIHDIPGEIHTIEDALDHLHERFGARQRSLALPSVVIAVPSNNRFPDLDGLIQYTNRSGHTKTYGYQAKTRRGYPRHDLPEAIDACFLLRGCAPERPFRKKKWYYVEEDTLRKLLGFNLAPFYPKDWGSVVTTDEFD